MQHRPIPMPVRGEPSAPTFDGNPRHLSRFLHHVEHLAARAHASDSEKITSSILYLEQAEYDLWVHIATDIPDDWIRFKAKIGECYPYDRHDLCAISGQVKRGSLETLDEVGDFYRKFLTITLPLLKRKLWSEQEATEEFISYFPREDHRTIGAEIRGAPKAELHTTYKSALSIYSRDAKEDPNHSFSSLHSEYPSPPQPAPVDSPDPVSPSDLPRFRPSSSPSPSTCHFCGELHHIMPRCHTAARYRTSNHPSNSTIDSYITHPAIYLVLVSAVPHSSISDTPVVTHLGICSQTDAHYSQMARIPSSRPISEFAIASLSSKHGELQAIKANSPALSEGLTEQPHLIRSLKSLVRSY